MKKSFLFLLLSTVLIVSCNESPDEKVTIEVDMSSASYGVDYSIDNLLLSNNTFTLLVPSGSDKVSFTLRALPDFEIETVEEVIFAIRSFTSGLEALDPASTTITISNEENYPLDNRAISFDGINDYIDLGNIYDDLQLPVTISAWIWLDPNASTSVIPIFDSQDGLPYYNGFTFLTSTTSTVGIQYGDGVGENNSIYRRAISAQFQPIMGRWVNFTAIMRGRDDMELFFNGVNVGGTYAGESILPMKSSSPTENAKIGVLNQNGNVFRFKGKIDELRIWNRSLTLQEIQTTIFTELTGNETGLIGYWNFNEATGLTVLDQSNNKFNGILIGEPTRVLSEVPVR